MRAPSLDLRRHTPRGVDGGDNTARNAPSVGGMAGGQSDCRGELAIWIGGGLAVVEKGTSLVGPRVWFTLGLGGGGELSMGNASASGRGLDGDRNGDASMRNESFSSSTKLHGGGGVSESLGFANSDMRRRARSIGPLSIVWVQSRNAPSFGGMAGGQSDCRGLAIWIGGGLAVVEKGTSLMGPRVWFTLGLGGGGGELSMRNASASGRGLVGDRNGDANMRNESFSSSTKLHGGGGVSKSLSSADSDMRARSIGSLSIVLVESRLVG